MGVRNDESVPFSGYTQAAVRMKNKERIDMADFFEGLGKRLSDAAAYIGKKTGGTGKGD